MPSERAGEAGSQRETPASFPPGRGDGHQGLGSLGKGLTGSIAPLVSGWMAALGPRSKSRAAGSRERASGTGSPAGAWALNTGLLAASVCTPRNQVEVGKLFGIQFGVHV